MLFLSAIEVYLGQFLESLSAWENHISRRSERLESGEILYERLYKNCTKVISRDSLGRDKERQLLGLRTGVDQ